MNVNRHRLALLQFDSRASAGGGPADRVSALWTTLAGLPEWFALAMALTFFCVIVRCGYREWGRRADTRSTRPGALWVAGGIKCDASVRGVER